MIIVDFLHFIAQSRELTFLFCDHSFISFHNQNPNPSPKSKRCPEDVPNLKSNPNSNPSSSLSNNNNIIKFNEQLGRVVVKSTWQAGANSWQFSHIGAKSWTTPQLTDFKTANHLETL